eukprot:Hpha_TRINITY_DN12060_c0_g1::TRINITY_DN12060_c0_g1_i1::g.141032::m.141032
MMPAQDIPCTTCRHRAMRASALDAALTASSVPLLDWDTRSRYAGRRILGKWSLLADARISAKKRMMLGMFMLKHLRDKFLTSDSFILHSRRAQRYSARTGLALCYVWKTSILQTTCQLPSGRASYLCDFLNRTFHIGLLLPLLFVLDCHGRQFLRHVLHGVALLKLLKESGGHPVAADAGACHSECK